ncbi:MAG: isochorismatase [Planctomycetaceae bacterium]|nr:MAG: isochorismatase [Planctomycetaceae bacterium]
MSMTAREVFSPQRIQRECSRLLLVDLQEKLLGVMSERERVVQRCRWLAEAAGWFGIPVTLTEQYPQGLGPTVEPLRELGIQPLVKRCFSAIEVLNWPAPCAEEVSRYQVVLAGVEAHVCVLQTALDLSSLGYSVAVVSDAVTSRFPLDAQRAGERLRDQGIMLVTAEMVLFEWCATADDPHFKALSRLVKARQQA